MFGIFKSKKIEKIDLGNLPPIEGLEKPMEKPPVNPSQCLKDLKRDMRGKIFEAEKQFKTEFIKQLEPQRREILEVMDIQDVGILGAFQIALNRRSWTDEEMCKLYIVSITMIEEVMCDALNSKLSYETNTE